MLVPARHFARASGMMQTSEAVSGILTPLVAGVLVTPIGLWGILAIDVATFLVAVGTLAVVRIPNPPPSGEPRRGLLREAHDGWAFVRDRPALRPCCSTSPSRTWRGDGEPAVQPHGALVRHPGGAGRGGVDLQRGDAAGRAGAERVGRSAAQGAGDGDRAVLSMCSCYLRGCARRWRW